MALSILHRMTGGALAVGFVVLVAWIASAAAGRESYEELQLLLTSTVGQLLLVAWSYAFFYHLCNGFRHLIWDTGRGLDKHQASRSAWFVLLLSLSMTAVFWFVV